MSNADQLQECEYCHREGNITHFAHLDDGYGNVLWTCDMDCMIKALIREGLCDEATI